MALEQWTAIADIVAGFGLIISLIFVGWQIRLNMELAKTDMFVRLSERVDDVRSRTVTDPDIADILVRADEDFSSLSHVERLKFSAHTTALFNHADAMCIVSQRGLGTDFGNEKGQLYYKGLVSSPARQAWWQRHAHEYSPLLRENIARASNS